MHHQVAPQNVTLIEQPNGLYRTEFVPVVKLLSHQEELTRAKVQMGEDRQVNATNPNVIPVGPAGLFVDSEALVNHIINDAK